MEEQLRESDDRLLFEQSNEILNSFSMSYDQATHVIHMLENTKVTIEGYRNTLELRKAEEARKRKKSWWGRHCWPQKRKWMYRFIIIITVILQLLNLFVITLLDTWPPLHDKDQFVATSSAIMIVLQLLNLFILIMASGRLAKQIYRQSVNRLFMAQTYGATILLFAGLYTLSFRLQRHSWEFISLNNQKDPVQVFLLYSKFLFYSISTATLCGSDNVLPVEWYNCIFAGFQMLLSFCYFASILGSSVSHSSSQGVGPTVQVPPLTPKHTDRNSQQNTRNTNSGSLEYRPLLHDHHYDETIQQIP